MIEETNEEPFELPSISEMGDHGDYLGTMSSLLVYEKDGVREFYKADGTLVCVNYCDKTNTKKIISHPGQMVQKELESWEGLGDPCITSTDYAALVDWLLRRYGRPAVPKNLFRHIRHNPVFDISDDYPSFVVLSGRVEALREVSA